MAGARERTLRMLRQVTGMEPAPTFDFIDLAWRWLMWTYVYEFDWMNTDVIRTPTEQDPRHFMEHHNSLVDELIRAHEAGLVGQHLVKGDCEDTCYTINDFAVIVGVPAQDVRIHRVAALRETELIDHALSEIRIGPISLCYDIYTPAPHRPYERLSALAPAHRWVDWQSYPVQPNKWAKTR